MALTLTPIDGDSFNRANEAALAAPWGVLDAFGRPALTSNVVKRLTSSTMRFAAYNTGQIYGADQYQQWVFAAVDASNRATVRIFLRQAVYLSQNFSYYMDLYNGGQNVRFNRVDAGGITTALGSASSYSACVAGDIIGAAVEGTQLYSLRNGVETAEVVDATYSVGVPMAFGLSYCDLDDWEAGECAEVEANVVVTAGALAATATLAATYRSDLHLTAEALAATGTLEAAYRSDLRIPADPLTAAGSLAGTGYTGLTVAAALLEVAAALSAEVVIYTPPPVAPTLFATPGNAQVTLVWPAVEGATGYTLYRATAPGVTTADTALGGVTSPHVDGGRTNGTAYYYRASATGPGGESGLSPEVGATPAGPVSGRIADLVV